jgi:hypothetical protein
MRDTGKRPPRFGTEGKAGARHLLARGGAREPNASPPPRGVELPNRFAPDSFSGGDGAIQRLEAIEIRLKHFREALFVDDGGFKLIVGVQADPGPGHGVEKQQFLGGGGLVGASQFVAPESEPAFGAVAVFGLADGSGFEGHECDLPPSR